MDMKRRIHVEESGTIPEDTIVFHYDELYADLKHSF